MNLLWTGDGFDQISMLEWEQWHERLGKEQDVEQEREWKREREQEQKSS